MKKKKKVLNYRYDKKRLSWCEVELDFVHTGANVMLSSVVEDMARRGLVWKIQGS